MAVHFNHAAYVVSSLDAAIEEFRDNFGLAFKWRPAPCERVLLAEGREISLVWNIAYSIEGPVRVELIEANPEGFLGTGTPCGIHHLGAWSADPRREAIRLESRGFRVEGQLFFGGEEPSIIFLRPTHGPLIELVTDAFRQPLLEWLEAEEDPFGEVVDFALPASGSD